MSEETPVLGTLSQNKQYCIERCVYSQRPCIVYYIEYYSTSSLTAHESLRSMVFVVTKGQSWYDLQH